MKVFVDTSALFAVLDEADPNHRDASVTWRSLLDAAELVTHNYIHVEAEALVRRRLGRDCAAVLIDRLLPALTTVWVDRTVHQAAVEASRVGGGATSLVDHVSFVVMRTAGIDVAFAFDADFERHGFRTAPAPDGSQHGRLADTPAAYEPSPSGAIDLVGVAEIAARSGHPTSTIQSWRRRHGDFPAPFALLASGPVWRWPIVEAWIRTEPRRLAALRDALPVA